MLFVGYLYGIQTIFERRIYSCYFRATEAGFCHVLEIIDALLTPTKNKRQAAFSDIVTNEPRHCYYTSVYTFLSSRNQKVINGHFCNSCYFIHATLYYIIICVHLFSCVN